LYAFVRLVGASDNTTKHQTARCRTFVVSSCRYRCTPNCTLSCGVLSQRNIVARFKSKDRLINQATGRQHAAQQRAVLACFARDRTSVQKRAVWRFVLLSLALARRTKRTKSATILSCVMLAFTMYAKRHVVVRRVIAMLHYRSV
jgi:hypothetical protein